MTDIKVEGQSIGVSPSVFTNELGGTVVDSGTNILLVPQIAYFAIQKIMVTYCTQNRLNNCNDLFQGKCFNSLPVDKFPSLQLIVGGASLNMTGSNYLLPETAGGPLCLAIKNTGPTGFTIIGDTTMTNYYVTFEKDRLGWAPVNPKTCFKN